MSAFTPEIIGELQARVRDHNAAVTAPFHVKLNGLKKLYRNWRNGGHEAALAKIDQHLQQLAGEQLEKARRPPLRGRFDPSEHPRGRGGQFSQTGGGHSIQIAGSATSPIIVGQEHPIQVIPETRYSVLGPPIAGAAGVLLGAAGGVGTNLRQVQSGGSVIDRTATAVARATGGVAGKKLGQAGGLAAHGVRQVARSAARVTRNVTGVQVPSPAAGNRRATVDAGGVIGRKAGRFVGHQIGFRSQQLSNLPAALTRHFIRNRYIGPAAAGLVGGLTVGQYVYGPALHHGAAVVGPYLDTLYPRRVQKADGTLIDDDEILAKIEEILSDEELAKISLGRIAGILRSAGPTVRAASRIFGRQPSRLHRTSTGWHRLAGFGSATQTVPAPTPERLAHIARAMQSGRQAFQAPAVPRTIARIGGQVGIGARRAIPIAGAGIALGALTGGALAHFNSKHPRDEHGRFADKPEGFEAQAKRAAAAKGAKIGGAVGLGLGVIAGVAAARRGQGSLLRAAIQRLGGDAFKNMTDDATTHAERAHAADFATRPEHAIPDLPPSGAEHPSRITKVLEDRAIEAWKASPLGRALRGGGRAWLRFHLSEEFDKAARREVRKLGEFRNGAGDVISGRTSNLYTNVSREHLTDPQKVAWDKLVAARDKAYQEIDDVYATKVRDKVGTFREPSALETERRQIDNDLVANARNAQDHANPENRSTLAQIQRFASQHLKLPGDAEGYKITSSSVANARSELADAFTKWEARAEARIKEIRGEMREAPRMQQAAEETIKEGLTPDELKAIQNPFATKRADRFFPEMPDAGEVDKAVREAATEPFRRESAEYVRIAVDHLHSLVGAHQAALEAQIPGASIATRAIRRMSPTLSAFMRDATKAFREMEGTGRASLKGIPKKVDDFFVSPTEAKATAMQAVNYVKKHGKEAVNWGFSNLKTLTFLTGMASAAGVVFVETHDGKQKVKVKIDPTTWKLPKDLGWVARYPDPLNPKNMVIGLTYDSRNPDREKFIFGAHVKSEDGSDKSWLPFNAGVQDVVNRVRSSGGSGGRAQINVVDPAMVNRKLKELNDQGHIQNAGAPGVPAFRERTGGNDTNAAEQDVGNGFFGQHISKFNAQAGQAPNNKERFYNALISLFNTPQSAVLSRQRRLDLLVGQFNGRRGVFGNKDSALNSNRATHKQVQDELERQIREHSNLLVPATDAEYNVMKNALWAVMSHAKGQRAAFSTAQMDHVFGVLDDVYRNAGHAVPGQAPQHATPGGSRQTPEQERDNFIDSLVQEFPEHERVEGFTDDDTFRAVLHSAWTKSSDPVQAEFNTRAAALNLRKQEPSGLRKYLVNGPTAPSQPSRRSITGSYLRREAHPARALSQIGTYGLGQAGYAAASLVANRRFPIGSGARNAIKRFGLETLGGGVGGTAGFVGGERLGRGIAGSRGPRAESPNESLARTGAGIVGQGIGTSIGKRPVVQRAVLGATRMAGQAISQPIAGAAGRIAASRAGVAIGGAARAVGSRVAGTAIGSAVKTAAQGAGQRIGGAIGGFLGRTAGGVAGTVAEPGGGTVAGGLAGFAAGQALGAGVGWLADEGVGLLYHHLSRYGSHVPDMAAKHLGHAPRAPRVATT